MLVIELVSDFCWCFSKVESDFSDFSDFSLSLFFFILFVYIPGIS